MELVFLKQLEASYFLQAPTSDFGVAKIKWRVIDNLHSYIFTLPYFEN